MLPRSKKAKGKQLEKYVADELSKIDKYAYRRADSGSGLRKKEDVFTTLPFFIECKNQAEIHINLWWGKMVENCPADKIPILIYKQNYQREPTVCTMLSYLLDWYLDKKISQELMFFVHLSFTDFINLVKKKYGKGK